MGICLSGRDEYELFLCDEIDAKLANYQDSELNKTMARSYPPNPWGFMTCTVMFRSSGAD